MRFHPDLPPADSARTLAAWRRFTRDGELDPSVRPHVRLAWERSRAHGCSPERPRADVLPAHETMALLRREARLVEIASPFLSALSRAAGADRHAAMLGDAEGRVLRIVADPLTAADESFPRAGSLLSEAAAGANGIGTALADGHYVELVGPEHFIEGFHPFTCQGVPLLLGSGEPLGVLSMSLRRVEAANRVRDILFCASEAAECELLSARLSEALGGRDASAAVLETLRQDMVQRIATTRMQLEIAARRIAEGTDASTVLESAERLIASFRRQAAIWRQLADEAVGSPEPIDLADLTHDFATLMATEARVAQVTLTEERLERVLVLDDAGALSRRLLTSMLSVFQRAERGSSVSLATGASEGRGVIRVRGTGSGGRAVAHAVDAPLLR
jgi:transcriptional regulator of acetoin/glycerol metabolism